MPGKLTYKKRLYLLLGAGLFVFFLSYRIAIIETVKISKNLKDIREKLSQIETAPESIAILEKKIASINKMIGENLNDVPEFQKTLLDRISSFCNENSLVLREFPQVHSWTKQDYQFITCYASMEGSFIPLLKLLFDLETHFVSGRMVSVDFYSNEDHRLKKRRLIMSIYIQTIKQTKNV
jgi:hypothetical protein